MPPDLWAPEPGFLNTASYGLPPRPAVDAMRAMMDDWRVGRTSWEPWDHSVEKARDRFARLIGAAAEMALASGVGVELRATSAVHAHGYLFGEDQGRYLLATPDPPAVLDRARQAGVRASDAGHVGGEAFASASLFAIALADLRQAHEGWMPGFMDTPAT